MSPADLARNSGFILIAVIALCPGETSVPSFVHSPVTPTGSRAPNARGLQIQAMESLSLDSNCDLKMNSFLLETSSDSGFLWMILKARLCWEYKRVSWCACRMLVAKLTPSSESWLPPSNAFLRLGRLVWSFISLRGPESEVQRWRQYDLCLLRTYK